MRQVYAPPFSSTKNPVAIAGYVAEDIITGMVKPIYWRDLRDIRLDNEFLLYVRTPDESSLGSLPDAVNIPLDEIRDIYKALVGFEVEFERVYGLSLNEAMILCALQEAGKEITPTALAEHTGMPPSHTSKVIRLWKKGSS